MSNAISELHNIMPIANLSSVMEQGIVCHNLAKNLDRSDVSMPQVQSLRDSIRIPNGMTLHQYANLYFHARNPMLYYLCRNQNRGDFLCVLRVSANLLQRDDVIVTDMNASRRFARFRPASEVNMLNLDRIYARYWTHPDNPHDEYLHKGEKCAEVLVPQRVDPRYIFGAYVASQDVKQQMIDTGFPHDVTVNRELFFR